MKPGPDTPPSIGLTTATPAQNHQKSWYSPIEPATTFLSKILKTLLPVSKTIRPAVMDDNSHAILTVISQIPKGKVATYGQIARLAGLPRNARQVGSVLRRLAKGIEIPWHRVVNAQGMVSHRNSDQAVNDQVNALRNENVEMDHQLRISLPLYQWKPS
ncbi:MAG: MGMT family protein [Pirellulaceae bacterium]|nr:MGMT family protein [Pirellulaceae bacterium]